MQDAWALLEQERFREAKEAFTAALEDGDDYLEAGYGRALAYAGLGRLNQAARDLGQVLEEDEDYVARARSNPALDLVLRDPHLIRALDPDAETALGRAVEAIYDGDASRSSRPTRPRASDAIAENPYFEPWVEEDRWAALIACDHLV